MSDLGLCLLVGRGALLVGHGTLGHWDIVSGTGRGWSQKVSYSDVMRVLVQNISSDPLQPSIASGFDIFR